MWERLNFLEPVPHFSAKPYAFQTYYDQLVARRANQGERHVFSIMFMSRLQ
jgi:hypothetical protein